MADVYVKGDLYKLEMNLLFPQKNRALNKDFPQTSDPEPPCPLNTIKEFLTFTSISWFPWKNSLNLHHPTQNNYL